MKIKKLLLMDKWKKLVIFIQFCQLINYFQNLIIMRIFVENNQNLLNVYYAVKKTNEYI